MQLNLQWWLLLLILLRATLESSTGGDKHQKLESFERKFVAFVCACVCRIDKHWDFGCKCRLFAWEMCCWQNAFSALIWDKSKQKAKTFRVSLCNWNRNCYCIAHTKRGVQLPSLRQSAFRPPLRNSRQQIEHDDTWVSRRLLDLCLCLSCVWFCGTDRIEEENLAATFHKPKVIFICFRICECNLRLRQNLTQFAFEAESMRKNKKE